MPDAGYQPNDDDLCMVKLILVEVNVHYEIWQDGFIPYEVRANNHIVPKPKLIPTWPTWNDIIIVYINTKDYKTKMDNRAEKEVMLFLHSSQADRWWCNKKHIQGVEEKQPDIVPHKNLNILVNQRQFIAKEEKLSGTELKQSQADVTRMIQITIASYKQSLSNKLMTINNTRVEEMENKIKLKLLEEPMVWVSIKGPIKSILPIYTTWNCSSKYFIKQMMWENYLNLSELNELRYATAAVIAGEVKEKTTLKNAKSESVWKKRIHKIIKCYRKELAILNELKKGVPTGQVCLQAKNILKKYTVNENIEELEQNIKMKLQAKT